MRRLLAFLAACFCLAAAHAGDVTLASGARLPHTLTVAQRTTTSLAPQGLALALTVGDVTGGQVLAHVATRDGANVFGPRAMRAGDVAAFDAAGRKLAIRLDALDNALVGDDRATFTLSAVSALSETEKIERLIGAIEALPGARFVRNGKEYPPAEAAAHLRRKWKHANGRADDARRFIDELASASSMSGKPYEIRYTDGRTATAHDFLLAELSRIQGY